MDTTYVLYPLERVFSCLKDVFKISGPGISLLPGVLGLTQGACFLGLHLSFPLEWDEFLRSLVSPCGLFFLHRLLIGKLP